MKKFESSSEDDSDDDSNRKGTKQTVSTKKALQKSKPVTAEIDEDSEESDSDEDEDDEDEQMEIAPSSSSDAEIDEDSESDESDSDEDEDESDEDEKMEVKPPVSKKKIPVKNVVPEAEDSESDEDDDDDESDEDDSDDDSEVDETDATQKQQLSNPKVQQSKAGQKDSKPLKRKGGDEETPVTKKKSVNDGAQSKPAPSLDPTNSRLMVKNLSYQVIFSFPYNYISYMIYMIRYGVLKL